MQIVYGSSQKGYFVNFCITMTFSFICMPVKIGKNLVKHARDTEFLCLTHKAAVFIVEFAGKN